MKLVRTELTGDMKRFVSEVCNSLEDQKASTDEYRQAAREVTKRFLPTTASKSAFDSMEKAVLDFMADSGYINRKTILAGIKDANGIAVQDIDTPLPKELEYRRYGCMIQFSDPMYEDEGLEMLTDSDFIKVSAYKLREQGVLYPNKYVFYAHPTDDCRAWAQEILEDYPGVKVGKAFNVVWSEYYDIEVTNATSTKLLKYNKLK